MRTILAQSQRGAWGGWKSSGVETLKEGFIGNRNLNPCPSPNISLLNSARNLNLEGVRSTCGTTEYHPHRFLGLTISDITLRLNVTATVTATLTATVTAMFLLLSLLLLMLLLLLLLLPLLMLLLLYCHSTVTGLTKMCSFPIKSNYPKRYQNAVF